MREKLMGALVAELTFSSPRTPLGLGSLIKETKSERRLGGLKEVCLYMIQWSGRSDGVSSIV